MNFKYNDGSNCGLAWRLWVTSHFILLHRKEEAKAKQQYVAYCQTLNRKQLEALMELAWKGAFMLQESDTRNNEVRLTRETVPLPKLVKLGNGKAQWKNEVPRHRRNK